MNETAQRKIEELKRLVLDLHRSAGMLDKLIMDIEFYVDGKDTKADRHYVRNQLAHRDDWLTMWGLRNASEKEKQIWIELIDSFKGD